MPVQFAPPAATAPSDHPKRMPRRFTPHPAKVHAPFATTRRLKKHLSTRQTRRKYYK